MLIFGNLTAGEAFDLMDFRFNYGINDDIQHALALLEKGEVWVGTVF